MVIITVDLQQSVKSVLTYLAYTAHLYRKNYVTLLENSFIINLGILAVGTLYVKQSGGSQLRSHAPPLESLLLSLLSSLSIRLP